MVQYACSVVYAHALTTLRKNIKKTQLVLPSKQHIFSFAPASFAGSGHCKERICSVWQYPIVLFFFSLAECVLLFAWQLYASTCP